MASFKPTVITERGIALMAKVVADSSKVTFTKVSTSGKDYTTTDVSKLTEIADVVQTALVSSVEVGSDTSITIKASMSNASLTTGYYIKTIGLYAQDPDLGEILYSVTVATIPDWMPAYNGLSSTNILVQLITKVSNASNVNVNVDPGAFATIFQITKLQDEVDDLKGYVGYVEDDIVGVEVDIINNSFTRLAGAKGLNPGEDFSKFNMYGGRRRCNLADDGTVLAYYEDDNYAVDGSNGQVMVEQPKFYYKMVPLNLIRVTGQQGFACTKFRLYLSDTQKSGFKIHPNFTRGSNPLIKDKVYMSAYEACI